MGNMHLGDRECSSFFPHIRDRANHATGESQMGGPLGKHQRKSNPLSNAAVRNEAVSSLLGKPLVTKQCAGC